MLGELPFLSIEEAYLDICGAIPDAIADIVRQRQDPFKFSYVLSDDQGNELIEVPFSELIEKANTPSSRNVPDNRRDAISSINHHAQSDEASSPSMNTLFIRSNLLKLRSSFALAQAREFSISLIQLNAINNTVVGHQ